MRLRTARRRFGGVRLFFALVFLPMMCLFPYLAAVNNPNENVRTYMTMALVEHHTFRIDKVVEQFGWVNDMAHVPSGAPGEFHFYSVKGPAVSYAAVPVYWAFSKVVAPKLGRTFPSATTKPEDRAWWMKMSTWVCRLFTIQLPCFLFLIWFERYLRSVTSDTVFRLSAVAAAGLGTNYLAYTHMFASHALFAVAAFASFAITEREIRLSRGDPKRRRASMAFLAGWFAGWATLLEYHGLPVSLILSVYGILAFWRPTRALAFSAGGLFHVALMMFFQWRSYGNPLMPGHKMVENPKFAAEHHQGVFGVLAPSWESFKSLSLDIGFGFFGTSPFMWLGVAAVPFALFLAFGTRREKRLRRVATFVWMMAMLALWLINAGAIEWRAGWTIGPRYLGAAPPFFAFGAVCTLEWIARKGPTYRSVARGVAGGLALASVLSIGLVGIVYDTLPESMMRPLAHFALPLARTGFVPHHVGEWFGWESSTFWYAAAGALIAAPAIAALWFHGEGPARYLLRVGALAAALFVGVHPAFTEPIDAAGAPIAARPDLRGFMAIWEPPGRDRISLARIEAERRGPRGSCYWYRIADLERVVFLDVEANRDERRATVPRAQCPKPPPL